MSPQPQRRGPQESGPAKGSSRSDAAWFAELDRDERSPEDEDGWRALLDRVRRIRPGRHAKVAIAVLGVAALTAMVVPFVYRGPNDCRRTPERARAYGAIRSQRDNVGGEEIGRRFRGEPFKCADLVSPSGVLVSVKEETGEAIIWFVDGAGEAHNVNLLAKAWTPALTPAPTLPADALQRIRE